MNGRISIVPQADRDELMPAVDVGALIGDAFETIKRFKVFIAVFTAACAFAALAYLLQATPVYTANGAILIDPRVGQNPNNAGDLPPGLLTSDALTIESELRVILSREVTEATVREMQAFSGVEEIAPEDPSPGLLRGLAQMIGLNAADPNELALSPEVVAERELEAQRREFMQSLRVERAGESFVLLIEYTSPDFEYAARAVNTLMAQYLLNLERQSTDSTERNRLWLSQRIQEVRSSVVEAENEILLYRQEHSLLAPEGASPVEISLNEAISEQIALQSQLLLIDVRIRQLGLQIESGQADVAGLELPEQTTALQRFQDDLANLRQEEQRLLLSWPEDSNVVVSVREQRTQTEVLILEEYVLIQERLQAQRDALALQIESVEAFIETLNLEFSEQNALSIQLGNLESDAEALRSVYGQLLADHNSVSQLVSFDGVPARIIANAVPPDNKSAPQSAQIFVLSILAGLILSISYAFVREGLNQTFRRHNEVEARLKQPVIGVFPRYSSDRRKGGLASARTIKPHSFKHMTSALKKLNFAVLRPESLTAETLRNIRVALLQKEHDKARNAFDKAEWCSVLGITSSVREEGKTQTAANLATYLASKGENVALVDFDMFDYGLSNSVGSVLPPENDLASVLADPEVHIELIQPSEALSGVSVLAFANRSNSDVQPELTIETIEELLGVLRGKFDYVIVDLPPAYGVSETSLLAQFCDSVVFLIRWGTTPRDQVLATTQRLASANVRFLGVVFTRARLRDYLSYRANSRAHS